MSEYSKFLETAEGIAREAGGLLREFYHRGVRTEYKGDVDLVTEADRASEKLIVSRLHEALPEHGVYGEEGARQGLEREFRWYIDPLAEKRAVPVNEPSGLPACGSAVTNHHRLDDRQIIHTLTDDRLNPRIGTGGTARKRT